MNGLFKYVFVHGGERNATLFCHAPVMSSCHHVIMLCFGLLRETKQDWHAPHVYVCEKCARRDA